MDHRFAKVPVSKRSRVSHSSRSSSGRRKKKSGGLGLGLTVSPAANRTIKQLRRDIIGDSLDLGRKLRSSHVHFVADVLRKAEGRRGGSEKAGGPLSLLEVLKAYDTMLK